MGQYHFDPKLVKVFRRFRKPMDIQLYLNDLKYNVGNTYLPPLLVLEKKRAHCMEGAIFAAAALRYLGHEPLIMDMVAREDYDHVIALFRKNNCWGAISKSNTTTLRYREPVYRTLRELCMSYFDVFFNEDGKKSLRKYSASLNLSLFDKDDWMNSKEQFDPIANYLDKKVRHFNLLKPGMARTLELVDSQVYKAGFLGADRKGFFKAEV